MEHFSDQMCSNNKSSGVRQVGFHWGSSAALFGRLSLQVGLSVLSTNFIFVGKWWRELPSCVSVWRDIKAVLGSIWSLIIPFSQPDFGTVGLLSAVNWCSQLSISPTSSSHTELKLKKLCAYFCSSKRNRKNCQTENKDWAENRAGGVRDFPESRLQTQRLKSAPIVATQVTGGRWWAGSQREHGEM